MSTTEHREAMVEHLSKQLKAEMAKPDPVPPPPTKEPGLYPGVGFDEYFRLPYANNSTLQIFQRSAAHARLEILSPSAPTPALDFGHKFHLAILEPERFEAETVLALDLPRRKNVDKDAHAQHARENAGKYILSRVELDRIKAMQAAVYAHPVARSIIQSPGLNEVCAVWDDPKLGVRCKSRQDMLREYAGYPFIFDVKTSDDASRDEFGRDIHKYKYDQQGAMYVDGIKALGEAEDPRFALIVIEKAPPYCIAIYELDDTTLRFGRHQYRENLKKYAECMATGEWPGYPMEMDYHGLPHWVLKRFAEGD